MKRLALLAAFVLVAGGLGLAQPQAVKAAACEGNYYIRLYEDSGHSGDWVLYCWWPGNPWNGVHDLNTVPHTQAGTCNSTAWYRVGDDWDDCVSSIGWYLPTNRCVAFFGNPNAGGALHKARDGRGELWYSNFLVGNDKVTSFYLGTLDRGTCTLIYNGARYSVPQDNE